MKLVLTTFFYFLVSFGYSQVVSEITFSEKSYDFGEIKEEAGPVTHEFKFINNTEKPVKILDVRASCGCTTPGWTKEPVAPGASGYVQAQYNPKNRPGGFNKSLTIQTDYSDQPIRLYIKGRVIPKPKSIEELLTTNMGGLRMRYGTFNMGKVYTSEKPNVKSFQVFNDTDSAITFLDQVEAPGFIEVDFEPKVLPAKTSGKITVKYYGKKHNSLGFSNSNLTLYTDQEGDKARKSMNVYATVLEYFPPLTDEEMAQAPRLKIENPLYDFDKLEKDGKVEKTFVLKNLGQSPLKIRKADPNCACTKAELSAKEIAPGDSINMKVVFDAKGRRGNQQKAVTIYSNDPQQPVQRVTVKGYVKDE
ncbi:MAG: DUF1573 domain-containing protein [Fulvivirga sp.]|nr:DUF1573 domain-containing protein [Fulvivirga sp.]